MAITEQFSDELAEEDKAISHERLLVRVILTLLQVIFTVPRILNLGKIIVSHSNLTITGLLLL